MTETTTKRHAVGRLLDRMVRSYAKHKRWKQADNKGWGMFGRLLCLPEQTPQFWIDWHVRYCNRLYRLTRGQGNPWKPYRGF